MHNQYFNLAKRHKNFKSSLLEKVKDLPHHMIETKGCEELLQLHKQQGEVQRYLHLMKSFLRFELTHDLLWTKTELEHTIIDLLLKYFKERFPSYTIAIQDKTVTYIYDKDIKEYDEELETLFPILDVTRKKFTAQLWESYYESQNISERRNIKLMKKMMPKKYWKQKGCERNLDVRKIFASNDLYFFLK